MLPCIQGARMDRRAYRSWNFLQAPARRSLSLGQCATPTAWRCCGRRGVSRESRYRRTHRSTASQNLSGRLVNVTTFIARLQPNSGGSRRPPFSWFEVEAHTRHITGDISVPSRRACCFQKTSPRIFTLGSLMQPMISLQRHGPTMLAPHMGAKLPSRRSRELWPGC
jgi:hypothetical protein